MAIHDGLIEESLAATGETVSGLGAIVSDTFSPADFFVTGYKAVNPVLSDTIGTTDAVAFLAAYTIFERLRLVDTPLPAFHYNMIMAELAAVRDTISRAMPYSLAESFTISEQLVDLLNLRLADSVGIAGALLPSFLYTRTVSERIRLAASIAAFFGADASDSFDITDIAVGPAYKTGLIEDLVDIEEAVTPLFLLRVTLNDRVVVEDADLVHMIFSGFVSEGVDIAAGFSLPGSGFTTWAMNTRTAAVSEYRNYDFNSFARIGNKYLGASQDGLFELMGDDDDGEDIIATIRSGFAQWAGAHLHSFKAAYLAVRGEGEFVVRLITGDGRVYNYTISQDAMRTTKVNMGKGLRARYFAFELVSSGQDFDFESLEFIPLAAVRRV